ncbi:hypothetical protein K3759_05145 [Sulfitobacter sp. W027]|uniref:hypothetical protein n=1 Tax=Sulfitobacter sp. W027 TaxID=2867025 RepID=UPI0021A40C3B|nr:hypothetical protein [Sulfitobacter sp. W027]UWR34479.1 hypothetical protein K3759_05145 [Sulfitobacter sp. W027]
MTSRELDEILHYRWPLVLRAAMAGSDEWLKGFARSIAKHGKRASWRPTHKQEQIMRRLVSELGTAPSSEGEVIER